MRPTEIRVALVDDDDAVRRAVGRLLRAAGMQVQVYASGAAFLDALAEPLPDCLVLDICMPSMNGLEVQDRLAGRRLRVPIVFITGHDEPEAERRALQAGAVACLHKPFSERQLLAAIAQGTRVAAGIR